jgi:signal transduction histidine kinase/CheY-like chemotaxis protein
MSITLKTRVFALVSVLVVSSMSALSCLLLANLKSRLQQDFEARGVIVASYFAADSVEGVIIEDQDSLRPVLERLFEIEDIAYAAIYDAKGTRIVNKALIAAQEGGGGESGRRAGATEITRRWAGSDRRVPVLDFRTPVMDEKGECLGSVQIGFSLERIDIEVRKLLTRSVAMLAVFVAIGFVGSLLVASSIANPIKALTRVFTLIAGGDLDHEIDTSRRDELGSLSANFATMRDSIRHKLQLLEAEALVRTRAEQELERHRDHLEELVRERTDELAGANAELTAEVAERKKTQEALIEARQKAEEFARQAEIASRSKSEFLANMSHEIRTPMTAILGFAGVLLEENDDASSRRERIEAAQTIRRNGEYLLDIINDILDLSKVEAGKMTVERIACEPCRVVADVASLVNVKAEHAGLAFDIEYVGAIPRTIRSDPTRLRQILINLIGNAIKFTEAGAVRLITQLVNDDGDPRLQFDVVDTGLGMTAEQADRLFQPFTQADSSTTRKFGGTGLGLTISKRFAELLGGDITLVKTQIGVGSRFRVTVATGALDGVEMIADPRSATVVTAASAQGDGGGPDQGALEGCRILLAEDGPDNQRLISVVLKKVGAKVTVAENGKRAVEVALAARDTGAPFDVILMDMQMPVMDGYQATATLRREAYTSPIIALTAHAMHGDEQKCLAAGCDGYSTKPIDRKNLICTIRAHVRAAPAVS